jgi:hypothetical protein
MNDAGRAAIVAVIASCHACVANFAITAVMGFIGRALHVHFPQRCRRYFFAALLCGGLTGCQDYVPQFNVPKFDVEQVIAPDPTQFARKERRLTPVTQADLVDAAGSCAAAAAAAPAGAQEGESAAPPPIRGVGLEMTECEVVQAAGPPASVEIGTNQRAERTVTMIYNTPERPIYHFAGGRLRTIERGAEPPPEPKKAAPKRKTRQAT